MEPSFEPVRRDFLLFGILPIILGFFAFLVTYVITTIRREEDMARGMKEACHKDLVEEEPKKRE